MAEIEIDNLVELLVESADVSSTSWADSNKTPRLDQWKSAVKSKDQRKRRIICLQSQNLAKKAKIENSELSRDQDSQVTDQNPDESSRDPQKKGKKEKKVFDEFKEKLMQSEWFVDIPNHSELDFWSFKIIPVGRRRLLNCQFGRSTLFDKKGKQTNRYWSGLPGGNKHNSNTQTLLDGIYQEETKTFFILDVLIWEKFLRLLSCMICMLLAACFHN
jgi:hypothetical protein